MPLVRDYCDSIPVNLLSDKAEILFARLLTKADVNGNYLADPVLIKSNCFPRKDYRISQISTWLKELATPQQASPSTQPTALLRLYENSGKQYLHISGYGQKLKWKKGLYPPPEFVDNLLPDEEKENRIEVEIETEEEAEENPRVSSFLKNNSNTEQPKPSIQKSSREMELRARTVESETWIKETARIQMKPVSQVKSFCDLWIQKKVFLKETGIDHPKATVDGLIKFMFEDLEKQKAAPVSQQYSFEPEPQKKYDLEKWEVEYWKRINKDFAAYKSTGKLEITGALNQLSKFDKAGLILPNAEQRQQYFEKAKLMVMGTQSDGSIRPGIYREFRKILLLRDAIIKNKLTHQQENEIKSIAAEMEIRDFYDGVEELEVGVVASEIR